MFSTNFPKASEFLLSGWYLILIAFICMQKVKRMDHMVVGWKLNQLTQQTLTVFRKQVSNLQVLWMANSSQKNAHMLIFLHTKPSSRLISTIEREITFSIMQSSNERDIFLFIYSIGTHNGTKNN